MKVSKACLYEALKDTEDIVDNSQKDIALLCQMLKDNISLWKTETNEDNDNNNSINKNEENDNINIINEKEKEKNNNSNNNDIKTNSDKSTY